MDKIIYRFPELNTKTRSETIEKLKELMIQKCKKTYEQLNKNDIGRVIISCVELDEEYFIPLDGRIVLKAEYPDLYEVYQQIFLEDTVEFDKHDMEIDQDVYFVIPNCYDRALIMIDRMGDLDNFRRLGSNLPWRLNLDMLLDFDLSKQMEVLKNTTKSDEDSGTNSFVYALNQIGESAYVTKETFKTHVEPSKYTVNGVRTTNKLLFNTRKIYFYTRYKVKHLYDKK